MENSAQAQQPYLAPKETDDEGAEGEGPKYDLAAEKERWSREFAAAKKWLEPLKKQAKRIEEIIRDERKTDEILGESKWNLFAANRETKSAMLYGRPPRVSVERRFSDATDDKARMASEISSRLLNTDIERTSDGFATALGLALLDRLDSGWSMVRERYCVEWEDVPAVDAKMGVHPQTGEAIELAAMVPATKRKTFEDVETDYVHLEDQLWQPCRNYHSMGWWATRNQMSEEDVEAKWGEEVAAAIPYDGKPPVMSEEYSVANSGDSKRADVWEVWDKDRKVVCWYVENYGAIECKPDPYGLDGFYPFPRPMVANPTTSKYLPRPDYAIAQDIFEELNVVTTRIMRLMKKGVRVTGAYDAKHKGLADIFDTTGDGVLLPLDNWSMAGDGIQNAVWVFPTAEIVQCVMQLRQYRGELIDAIGQITGMSDIMRGEATQAGATATEQRIKSRMGSVRMQAMQDDFARFASEAQQIRAQLMAKFFEPETIAQRSNAEFLPKEDQQFVGPAIQLIKSPAFSQYRIVVKSESLSMSDFAATKADKFEAAGALAQVFQMGAGLAQAMGPAAMPFVFKMAKSLIAGMRGTSDMEAAFDEAVKAAEQMQQQAAEQSAQQGPPVDPKVQAEKAKQETMMLKGQLDTQHEQTKAQLAQQQAMVDVQADAAREENQRQSNVKEFAQRQQIAAVFRPPPKPGGVL